MKFKSGEDGKAEMKTTLVGVSAPTRRQRSRNEPPLKLRSHLGKRVFAIVPA